MTKVKTYIATLACTLLMAINTYAQHTVTYDLYVNDTLVNYTGKSRKALAINGQIPAPALHFTEGDTAVIRVHNERDILVSFTCQTSRTERTLRRICYS